LKAIRSLLFNRSSLGVFGEIADRVAARKELSTVKESHMEKLTTIASTFVPKETNGLHSAHDIGQSFESFRFK